MYFINLERDRKDRYAANKFMEWKGDMFDILDSYFIHKVKSLPIFGVYSVSFDEKRPELISYRIYGAIQYWYILMIYNNRISNTEFSTGDQINYPSISDIEDLFFGLKAQQKTVEG